MRFKFLLCAILIILAISVYAADDKYSVDYTNMPVANAIKSLFQQTDKNYVLSPYIQNGYINIKMTDKPFDTILSAVLKQVNATFEFKDGTYFIDPSNNTRNGMMGGGMNNPMGGGMNNPMGGGMDNPMMGGGMGTGAGMGMGRNQMGGGMNGMGGMNSTQTPEAAPWEKDILKIPVKYNSPNQILSLMDGDDYVDVVYYGSGSSGSSGSDSNSSSSSSSSSNSSSSSSSRSSNR